MNSKDHSCPSFNGNARIRHAAISRFGTSHNLRVGVSFRIGQLSASAADGSKVQVQPTFAQANSQASGPAQRRNYESFHHQLFRHSPCLIGTGVGDTKHPLMDTVQWCLPYPEAGGNRHMPSRRSDDCSLVCCRPKCLTAQRPISKLRVARCSVCTLSHRLRPPGAHPYSSTRVGSNSPTPDAVNRRRPAPS